MSFLRAILITILGVLAFVGGVNITMRVPRLMARERVRRIARKLDDCKCGSHEVEIMVSKSDHNDIRVVCCKCHRIISHGNIAERWNAGEEDEGGIR